jgi:hypothetical protein
MKRKWLIMSDPDYLRFVYKSKLSSQDLANQAEKDQRMSEFTRGGKLFGMPFGARWGRS